MAKIMNTAEIESAITGFQNTYPDLCLRLELPEATYEGRTCHALRIGKSYGADKPAILILGGVPKSEAFAFAVAAQGMVIIVGAALVGAAGIWMLFTRFRPSARAAALPA